METVEVVYVVPSVWTTVSYGDTTITEKVFQEKLDAFDFIQAYDPSKRELKCFFVSMRLEAVSFVKHKEN